MTEKEEAIIILDGFKDNPLFNEQHKKALDMAIKALSENKGEWIPVNERLPEDYNRVLITVNGCRGLIVREAKYHKAQNEFEVLHNHERWEVGEKGLLAWQPLPEAYKTESYVRKQRESEPNE